MRRTVLKSYFGRSPNKEANGIPLWSAIPKATLAQPIVGQTERDGHNAVAATGRTMPQALALPRTQLRLELGCLRLVARVEHVAGGGERNDGLQLA